MNNPDKRPTARHYDGIRRAACGVLGIAEALGSVRPTAGPPVRVGQRHNDYPPQDQDGPIPLSPPGTAIA